MTILSSPCGGSVIDIIAMHNSSVESQSQNHIAAKSIYLNPKLTLLLLLLYLVLVVVAL